MYAGRIVELGPSEDLFRTAAHPYTRRLVAAVPHLDGRRDAGRHPRPGAVAGSAAARAARSRPAAPWSRSAAEPRCPSCARRQSSHSARCCQRRKGARAGRVRARHCRRPPCTTRPSRCSRWSTFRAGYIGSRSSTTSTSRSRRRSASRSWASRAPARRRSHARSSACTASAAARSCCGARRSRRPPGHGRATCAGDPVRVPEPVRLAQPAPHDRPDRAPAARALRRRRRPKRSTGGSPRCSSGCR